MSENSPSERFGVHPKEWIAENLKSVRARIHAACERSGRDPESVRLLPVSKTVPIPILREAVALGLTDLGENKVQEAKEKWEAMQDLPVRWHVIGHLQANKAKYVARFASEFQALDRLEIAELLNRRLEIEDRTLEVLVQVNTSGEETKFGLAPEAACDFVKQLPRFPRLQVRGMMTLAMFTDAHEHVRACFQKLRHLRDVCQQESGISLQELSMGMSGDFEIAIEEGATIVRVGSAIFGVRPGSDAHYWPGLIPEKN